MKLNIEISDKQAEFLKQYAKVYEGERNIDGIADQIVIVEKEVRIPTREGLEDGIEYVWEDIYGNEMAFETIDELKEAIIEREEDISEKSLLVISVNLQNEINITDSTIGRFTVNYYVRAYEVVAYFLTIEEAKKYMRYHKHNPHRARVVTKHMRNSNYDYLVECEKLLLDIGRNLNGDMI